MNNEPQIKDSASFNPRGWLAKLQEKFASSPYSYLAFCFIVPTLIMFLVYLAMGIHPFGDGTVLVLDLNGQYVYFYEALRNTVYGEGSMLYTFLRGLGGEFIGMYAYYLASPLSYIVALFPQENILEALLTIILLKVGLCGLTFGFYLHKNSKHQNKVVTVAFSVMYALCAYAVVYQNNIMWIDALIWLPLITYGIEQLIKNGRYKLFVVSLSLCIMSNFYIGYMTCIFVALYYFYYCFAHTKEELNPHGYKLHMLRSFIRIAFFSLLAVAISAFIILGAYYSLTFGKTTFSDPNWSFKTKFDILDFLTKFLPGSYDTVRPTGLPYVYTGVLTLILVPVYFMTKKISSREKVASLIFIVFFVLCFIASPLDLIWHGFQNPNWLNYRYSFMLCFFLLVLAYKGFGNLRSVSEKFILGVSAFIILFVAVCDKLEFESYVEGNASISTLKTVWLTVIATIALLVVLCLLIRQKNPLKRENLSGILAIVVCIEIFCSSIACVTEHQSDVGGYTGLAGYTNYTEFIGGLRPIVNEIKESDDGFYRMEKLVHRKVNDNMALGIRGLSNSTSTLNSETIAFLKRMGYSARSHRSIYYGGTPVNDSLLGIKYLIDSNNSNKISYLYEYSTTNGNYSAYLNPYALSIAYGVDSSISDFNMGKYGTHFERLNALVSTMLGDDNYPQIFSPIDRSIMETTTTNCTEDYNGSSIKYTPDASSSSCYITYTFVAPTSAEYFFHTPARIANETTLYINNTRYGKYLGSDTNNIVSLGYFKAGESVSVKLELDDKEISLYSYYDYIWYINEDTFNSAFSSLKNNPQFTVTEYTDDNLIGTIKTSKAKQTIQTTIPYDEGWKVYVDGQEVEIYKTLDALIAFDIESIGEHSLEFKYRPEIYALGATISIIGTGIFLALCLADIVIYFVYKKKKQTKLYSVMGEAWVLDDINEDYEEMLLIPDAEKKKGKKLHEYFTRLFGKKNKKFKPQVKDDADKKGDN